MKNKYLKCANQSFFDALNLRLTKAWNESFPNSPCDQWTTPSIHPITNEIFICVDDRVIDALTESERDNLLTPNINADSWWEGIGFSVGGYTLAVRQPDRDLFVAIGAGLAFTGAPDSKQIPIWDWKGETHIVTVSALKKLMASYMDYCIQIKVYKESVRDALR